MRLAFVFLAAICITTAMQAVFAHHSQGMYDISTLISLEGTIRRVRWTNPHAWVFVDVEDDNGNVQIWALEGGSPAAVAGEGVDRNHLLPGDRVGARCHPLRDGSAGCVLGFVTPMHGDAARGHGVERPWN